ncbi:sodium-coupled monocarboxylate transporter 1 [Glossina fuscipes]|uniref:Sodium-coupled monocarboxylate transporter 1 n=1 Tax=Glossina fuscipes TaxID=7396 RepID=A0A9C5ZNC9_9MUSC|nr:sodium-coupled monocarboxylate transporter 1 [Glossina fuscipes]
MNVDEVRKTLQRFGWADYLVFTLMLASCAVIGIHFALKMRRKSKKTSNIKDAEDDYLVGGRKMKLFPITMSLISSFISGITLLGTTTDVYLYGTQYMYTIGSLLIMGLIMYSIFLPVFHELKLISTYEYLEARFDKRTRFLGSTLFIFGSMAWLPIVIYVPAIAFNQATGINIHQITPLVCLVCIFYTCVGGLKAVVWTDVIQTIIMLGAMTLVLVKGTIEIGGPGVVFRKALESGRIEPPNFTLDLTERYTAYSLFIGGIAHWLKSNAINQNMIQRYLALPTLKMARAAVWTFITGIVIFLLICGYCGLLIYATYSECDPLQTKLTQHKDQLLPLLVMDTLGDFPGLPGLFVAGVFSAALSSLSTGLNSMSAVILEDFFKSWVATPLTATQTAYIMRSVVVIFGAICVALVFVVEKLGTVLQLSITLSSVSNGPLLGIFTAGVMLPWVEELGILFGGITSLIFMVWLCVNAKLNEAKGFKIDIRKPSSIAGCNYTFSDFTALSLVADNSTETVKEVSPSGFHIYNISFLYYTMLGALITITIASIASFCLGFNKVEHVEPKLLSPFVRRWLDRRKERKRAIHLSKYTKPRCVKVQVKQTETKA